ncbi:MAG: hypothetical protein JW772_05240 [Candidatus Diapherotrites archaeon]|nr:hypothetical protein [Candidatus Diapherotrites archaeon]
MFSGKFLIILAICLMVPFAMAECGNGQCESGEPSTCPGDCPTEPILEINVLSPVPGQIFYRGEPVLVKIQALVDGEKGTDLEIINSYGFFGNIILRDDGDHEDEKWKDGIYANSFQINSNDGPFIKPIFIYTKRGHSTKLDRIEIIINNDLNLNLKTDKPNYYLGDEINFSGSIARRATPIETSLELTVKDGAEKEYVIPIETDETGFFSANLHTSLIDATGNWTSSFAAADDYNNSGTITRTFEVKDPSDKSFLEIEVVEEPLLFYRRGDDLVLLVKVFDDQGNEINEASIELETPLGEKLAFDRHESNVFYVATKIPVSMPAGKQIFFVRASASKDGLVKSGDMNVSLNIKEIGITTELLEPKSNQAQIGETIIFTVRMFYENGLPVSLDKVPAKINGNEVELFSEGGGIYSMEYIVKESDSTIDFAINFSDSSGNPAKLQTQISVQGISFMHYLREYWHFILTAILILAVIGFLLRKQIKAILEMRRLKRQLAATEALLAKNEKEYVAGKISREEFNKFATKYNGEIIKLKNRIEKKEGAKNGKK